VFVPGKFFQSNKHSSLLQKSVNYGRKKFYNIGRRSTKAFDFFWWQSLSKPTFFQNNNIFFFKKEIKKFLKKRNVFKFQNVGSLTSEGRLFKCQPCQQERTSVIKLHFCADFYSSAPFDFGGGEQLRRTS
jgi:hypothetical protein